ncbi:MAG: hypothetical protein ACI8QW_001553, partial [Saprospiraceae bacterium]
NSSAIAEATFPLPINVMCLISEFTLSLATGLKR